MAVALLSDVGAEENWKTFLEHGNTSLLHDDLIDIDIGDWLSFPYISKMINGQEAIVFVARIVNEGYELLYIRSLSKFNGSHGDSL